MQRRDEIGLLTEHSYEGTAEITRLFLLCS